jgi:hypothetical protein
MQKLSVLLSVSVLASFLLISGQAPAIASGLSCPAPVPLGFELKQKFPLDIINPHLLSKLILIMLAMGAFKLIVG